MSSVAAQALGAFVLAVVLAGGGFLDGPISSGPMGDSGAPPNALATVSELPGPSSSEVDCGGLMARPGEMVRLDAACLLTAEPAASLFRWDLDGDGAWDTEWREGSVVEHTWTAPFAGTVRVQGAAVLNDSVRVAVEKQPPTYFGVAQRVPRHAQSFVVREPILTAVELRLFINWGSPSPDFFLLVRDSLDGENLTEASVPAAGLPDGQHVSDPGAWTSLDFPDLVVSPGGTYYLLMYNPAPDPATGAYGFLHEGDIYPEGVMYIENSGIFEATPGDWQMRLHTGFLGTPVQGRFAVTIASPLEVNAVFPSAATEGTAVSFAATARYWGAGDLTFTWDFGDDSSEQISAPNARGAVPFDAAVSVAHFYGDDGLYPATVTVTAASGESVTDHATVTVNNIAPAVSAGPDRVEVESSTLHTFTSSFTDPGFDWPAAGTVEDFTAMIDWGYGPTEAGVVVESPGGPGVLTSGTITATHAYGDDGTFVVTVTVCDDDDGCGTDSLTVTVGNVAPSITEVAAYVPAEITLRVAGEKWHDVCLEVIDYGTVVTASVCVVRYPGSPDRQSATISGQINLLGGSVIRVTYTPDDDPVNGRRNGDNPVWVELGWEDGSSDRLFHNFNVQHPDTWEWTLDDLKVFLVGKPIHFGMDATDPGSDDLTFTFEFRDGASYSETDYNDGVAADPDPSPEMNPIAADAQTTHAYAAAGTYTVVFRVADDDGGVAEVTAAITV